MATHTVYTSVNFIPTEDLNDANNWVIRITFENGEIFTVTGAMYTIGAAITDAVVIARSGDFHFGEIVKITTEYATNFVRK